MFQFLISGNVIRFTLCFLFMMCFNLTHASSFNVMLIYAFNSRTELLVQDINDHWNRKRSSFIDLTQDILKHCISLTFWESSAIDFRQAIFLQIQRNGLEISPGVFENKNNCLASSVNNNLHLALKSHRIFVLVHCMQLSQSLQFPQATLSENFWLHKKVNFRAEISEHAYFHAKWSLK